MKLATVNEAARELGVSAQMIRRNIEAGKHSYVPIGARKMVDMEELTDFYTHRESTIGTKEASELTGLPMSVILRGVKEGWLPCDTTGKAFLFVPGELLDALEKLKQKKK